MPARNYREGDELEAWEARKRSHTLQMAIARETVKSLSGHTLLRLKEAASMLGVTVKTLRDLECQSLPNWPQRVYISPKVTGYRLRDMEGLIDAGLGNNPADADAREELDA